MPFDITNITSVQPPTYRLSQKPAWWRFQSPQGSVILGIAPRRWWEALPFDFVAERITVIILGIVLSFVGLDLPLLAAVQPGSVRPSILRGRYRRTCRLAQRVGTDRRGRDWADRRRCHARSRTGQHRGGPLAVHQDGHRPLLRGACRRCGISRCPRPRPHRHTWGGLAADTGTWRGDHCGRHGVGALEVLHPARSRTGVAAGLAQSPFSKRRSSRTAEAAVHLKVGS